MIQRRLQDGLQEGHKSGWVTSHVQTSGKSCGRLAPQFLSTAFFMLPLILSQQRAANPTSSAAATEPSPWM